MNDPVSILPVVLFALLAGAVIPVLYQLYHVLRKARAVLDSAGPRLDRALDRLADAADSLNGLGTTLEARAHSLRPLLEATSTLGHLLGRTGQWLATAATIGGSVGPAVAAGLRALFSRADERPGSGDIQVLRRKPGNGHDDQHQ
jgi:hypothetical protein